MEFLSNQQRKLLLKDLGLPDTVENYYDFSKHTRWPARVILLTALLQGNETILKPELIYASFALDESSISNRFGFREIKTVRDKIPHISKRDEVNTSSARNVVDRLVEDGLLLRIGKNNRQYVLSEIGKGVAFLVYAYILEINEIKLVDVSKFLNEKMIPKNKTGKYRRLMLLEPGTKKPSFYAESLGSIIQKSLTLQDENADRDVEFHIASKIRETLLERVINSESPMLVTKPDSPIDIIPSDWIYRLDTRAKHDREFDFMEWYNRLSEADFNFDNIQEIGISIIANPGHGKTKWMEQSSVELWNSQWSESRVETISQMIGKVSILPVVIDLRKISLDNSSKIYYEKKDQIIWPMTNLEIDPPFQKTMAQLLKAILSLPTRLQDLEQVVRDFKYGTKIILFLDGWDELRVDARKQVANYVKYYLENQIPVVISSRIEDSYLDEITPERLTLGTLSDEVILKYAHTNDMDLDIKRLKNIRKWIGNITPLDLRVLSVFPVLDNLPQKRVALYRNWMVFQTIREGCIDRITQRFETEDDVKKFLISETYSINSEIFSLFDLLHGFPKSDGNQLKEDHSIMHYVSKVAYFELMENNEKLDYREALHHNPLLSGFIDEKLTIDLRSYPQIRQKHLIPYLAAEFIFREYQSGRYWSVNGSPFTLSFLEEVLDYDGHFNAGHEKMKASQLKYAIILEAESQDNFPQPLTNIYRLEQPPYYSSIYHSMVGYWAVAKRDENVRAQNLIIQCIDFLVHTSCYNPTEIALDPTEFVGDIYLIERELREIDPIPILHGIQSPEYDILIRDRVGLSVGFVGSREIDVFYSEQLILRPWLIPWIIRVASSDVREKTLDLIETLPNTEFQYNVLKYQIIEEPSERMEVWTQILSMIIKKKSSISFILLLAELMSTQQKMSDVTLESILTILSRNKIQEELKYSVITSTERCKLSRVQGERIRQTLHDAPKLKQKFYLSLAALHRVPNIDLESFFLELEQNQEYRWMSLIVKPILHNENQDIVNERFLMLPLSTINILEQRLLEPQTYFRFTPGKSGTVKIQYLKEDETKKLEKLCHDWWTHYLTSIKDVIDILDEILVEDDDLFDEIDRKHVPYEYHSVLERLAAWVGSKGKNEQQEFILACLEKKFDITILTERNILKPLLDNLKDDDEVNQEIFELYREEPYFLLDIWGKDTWMKFVPLFPRDIMIGDERFFTYFVEAGCLSSIIDAIEAVESNPYIMRDRDSTAALFNWLSSRSNEDTALFVERILEFDIHLVSLTSILRKLQPIEDYEQVHSKLIEIAKSGEIKPLPRNLRENPDGFGFPKHEIAYSFLSSREKLKVIRPMFDRLQISENLGDEHVNNIIYEYLHIAEPKDIRKLAKFLDEFPFYSDAVCFEKGPNIQTLKELITNPITRTLIEILEPGYDEFLKGADAETAKNYMNLLLTGDSDIHYWARYYAYHMFKQREDLQDFVIECLSRESFGWDNLLSKTGWIEFILSMGKLHHTKFIATLIEEMEMKPLIELYRNLIFKKDEECYHKLCSVISHLNIDRAIIVTISAIAHLGKELGIEISDLWETEQYKNLSSKNRIDLKSGRWFDEHLDNTLKGEWYPVVWPLKE